MEEEIQRLTARLADEKDSLSARVKKRIYQKIGKLKKQLPTTAASATNEESSLKRALPLSFEESERKKAKIEENLTTTMTNPLPQESTNYTKKERKTLLHLLNKEIKECAIKKQLNRAKKSFRQHCTKGLPVDVHTYSSLLNCFIRCQDIVGGKALFETVPSPNLVTYTIMLRGYCEAGMMKDASELFFDRMIPTNQWNIRSLNTFLRGCLRTGFISTAVKAFEIYQMKQIPASMEHTQTEEDNEEEGEGEEEALDDPLQQSACYESMVSLLTRSGRIPDALKILKQYLDFISSSSNQQQLYRSNFLLTNAALTIIIARFLTVFGYFSEAKKYLLLTEEILSKKDINSSVSMRKLGGTSDDRRGVDESHHQKSVQLFQKFQKKEIQSQVEQCEEYLARIQSVLGSSTTKVADFRSIAEVQQIEVSIKLYENLLQQVFYFGFQVAHCDNEDFSTESMQRSFLEHLIEAMISKFGFGRLSAQHLIEGVTVGEVAYPAKQIEDRLKVVRSILYERNLRVFPAQNEFDDTQVSDEEQQECPLNLSSIFQSGSRPRPEDSSKDSDGNENKKEGEGNYEQSLEDYYRFLDAAEASENKQLSDPKSKKRGRPEGSVPVCLEIGSGNGDWIVAQAAFDRQLVEVEDLSHDSDSDGDADEREGEETDHSEESDTPTSSRQSEKITLKTLAKQKEREKQKHLRLQAKKKDNRRQTAKRPKKMKKVWEVKANWIALELRYDRCSNILTNHFLELAWLSSYYQQTQQQSIPPATSLLEDGSLPSNLPPNNLAIFSGDAKAILHRCLPARGLAQIFINYPQPPERITAGMHGKDQGKHLYTPDLLRRMIELLEPHEGKLTILSDNLLYIQLLATNLHQISEEVATKTRRQRKQRENTVETINSSPPSVFAMVSQVLPEEENVRRVQEILPIGGLSREHLLAGSSDSDPPAIIIYRGDPGPECGHHVSVSSYFDRMWTLGQKKRRWFVHLVKTAI